MIDDFIRRPASCVTSSRDHGMRASIDLFEATRSLLQLRGVLDDLISNRDTPLRNEIAL